MGKAARANVRACGFGFEGMNFRESRTTCQALLVVRFMTSEAKVMGLGGFQLDIES